MWLGLENRSVRQPGSGKGLQGPYPKPHAKDPRNLSFRWDVPIRHGSGDLSAQKVQWVWQAANL